MTIAGDDYYQRMYEQQRQQQQLDNPRHQQLLDNAQRATNRTFQSLEEAHRRNQMGEAQNP